MSDEKKKNSNKKGIIVMVANIVIMICNYVIQVINSQSDTVAKIFSTVFNA